MSSTSEAVESPLLAAALGYAARGWKVFPLHTADSDACSCRNPGCSSPGKHPRIPPPGHNAATSDLAQIAEWWGAWPDANIGLACRASGIVVLDVDPRNGGDDTLAELLRRHGPLPETPTADTGGGGQHLLFRDPGGSLLGKLGPGIDIKSNGYVVAAPSVHVSGGVYLWRTGLDPTDVPIASLPAWALDLAKRERPSVAVPANVARHAAAELRADRKFLRARAWLAKRAPAVEKQNGDDWTYRTAAHLRDFDLTEEEAFALLLHEWNDTCSPPWSAEDLRSKVRNAYAYGKGTPGQKLAEQRTQTRAVHAASTRATDDEPAKRSPTGAASGDDAGQVTRPSPPRIEIRPAEHEVVDEAIEALAAEPELYQRGGMLVHVVTAPSKVQGNREVSRIASLPPPRLRELMAANAVWIKRKISGEFISEKQDHPPKWAVEELAARGQWPGIRVLDAVVDTPVLRRDGTVLDRPGYDQRTGILYRPSAGMEQVLVPVQPTRDDARRAAAKLLEVVAEFPFATGAHMAAWLAGILTPLARYAFSGPAPLFLVDANVRGAGKTLLCDVVGMVTSGREMAKQGNAKNEEMAKRITALALEGATTVLLDNVAGMLGCEALDRALTATTWKDRILGASANTDELPLLATWYATGNNVVLAGDMTRRTLHIRLSSSEERPEERSGFSRPDLLGFVSRERPGLVAAALTVLRSYCAAGRPSADLRPWGSFNGWSQLVRSAVVWAGLDDPADTREELVQHSDAEAQTLYCLVMGWRQLDPEGKGLTAKQALEKLKAADGDEFPLLRTAVADLVRGEPDATALAKQISKLRDRVISGGYCIRKLPKTEQGVAFAVERTKPVNLTLPLSPAA